VVDTSRGHRFGIADHLHRALGEHDCRCFGVAGDDRQGIFCFSITCPAALISTRSLASAGRMADKKKGLLSSRWCMRVAKDSHTP